MAVEDKPKQCMASARKLEQDIHMSVESLQSLLRGLQISEERAENVRQASVDSQWLDVVQ